MLHYHNRIGDVRMREESVRVRVLALVNSTLELERLTDGLVAGRGGIDCYRAFVYLADLYHRRSDFLPCRDVFGGYHD